MDGCIVAVGQVHAWHGMVGCMEPGYLGEVDSETNVSDHAHCSSFLK